MFSAALFTTASLQLEVIPVSISTGMTSRLAYSYKYYTAMETTNSRYPEQGSCYFMKFKAKLGEPVVTDENGLLGGWGWGGWAARIA